MDYTVVVTIDGIFDEFRLGCSTRTDVENAVVGYIRSYLAAHDNDMLLNFTIDKNF